MSRDKPSSTEAAVSHHCLKAASSNVEEHRSSKRLNSVLVCFPFSAQV